MTDPATARFGAVLNDLYGELDWTLLGTLHCHEGGEDFFGEEAREALLDAGLRLAGDLGAHLARLSPDGPRRSLYVGASIAELPALLFESIVARRRVMWVNLPGPESEELARALAAVGERERVTLPRPLTQADWPPGPFDHLWLASVLTDPEHFPALHDELYERRGTDLAAGGGDLQRERRDAERLVARAVRELVAPAVLVTSDEEVPFVTQALERRSLALSVPNEGRTSPIVGDVLRMCTVKRSARG